MDLRDRVHAAAGLAIALAGGATAPAAHGSPPLLVRHEDSRMSMGSSFAIVAYGPDQPALAAAAEAALDEVDRIDRLMSHYKADSPLSRLNREAGGGPVRVEAELFDFIAEALRYSRESDGAFDVTVGPLMKTWGFFRGGGRLPAEEEVAEVKARIGYRHVVLEAAARTIAFARPGMELDLGGIAKGYAVDRAVAVLRDKGVAAALVSAGGSTLYGLGAPPEARAWDVSVQDPVRPRATAVTVPLHDRALSISGSYEKSFEVDGVRYSHIMDPRTARPVQGVLSVAVASSSGTAGDALDNVLFVLGVERGRRYLKEHVDPRTEAWFFVPAATGTARGTDWTLVHAGGSPDGARPVQGAGERSRTP